MAPTFPTLNDVDLAGKTVLVRADLNVPMEGGRVTDATRIIRFIPTLQALLARNAKVGIFSHFGRPKGKFDPAMSLAPLVDALSEALGKPMRFGVDCVGHAAQEAMDNIPHGGVVLFENLRFHAGEEANDPVFARGLAALGDVYVNDAFSCSHRAHASIEAITHYLPSAAGLLFQQEVEMLESIFTNVQRPLGVVVGGSKVSTKLALLTNLIKQVDVLAIGGAMANTFLLAQGHDIGRSLCEREMVGHAKEILQAAKKHKCRVVLPVDLVVTERFGPHASCLIVPVDGIPPTHTATDIGPQSVAQFGEALNECKTVVWNGPVGAFETRPFDASTITVARMLAGLTYAGKTRTIAGGGDTLAALSAAGLSDTFTYLSTAGGAFLEWLEGQELPGITALRAKTNVTKVSHSVQA